MGARKSFSLVEVLVFVSILSLFFITAVSVTTFSIRNLKIQEYRILATRYAEEAVEWVKQEKEDDWQLFATRDDSGGSGTAYCLNSLNWDNKTDCNGSYTLGPPNIFKRKLLIVNSGNPVDKISTDMTVSWLENDVEQKIVLKAVSNLWE